MEISGNGKNWISQHLPVETEKKKQTHTQKIRSRNRPQTANREYEQRITTSWNQGRNPIVRPWYFVRGLTEGDYFKGDKIGATCNMCGGNEN